jgi:hypothetical protein
MAISQTSDPAIGFSEAIRKLSGTSLGLRASKRAFFTNVYFSSEVLRSA